MKLNSTRQQYRGLALLGLSLALLVAQGATLWAQGGTAAVMPPWSTSFEAGVEEWVKGADVPLDPNGGAVPVYWDIAPVAVRGQRSAVFALDGRQDDGVIWLTRPVSVTGTASVSVTVETQVWSRAENFNTHAYVALYAGPQPPTGEADFVQEGRADDHAGWKAYQASFSVTPADGQVWVAVGISAIFETQMTFPFDDVTIRVNNQVVLAEDFEAVTREMEGWTKGSEVPADPNRSGRPVVWSIEPGVVRTGQQSAGFLVDGAGDDGLVWLTRPVSVSGASPVTVTVETHAWAAFESFNTLAKVALYAGPTPPAVEADFYQGERADDHADWRPYRTDFQVTPQDGQVWIAVGYSIVWETLVWFPMDDVLVCIDGRCEALFLPHIGRPGQFSAQP